MYTRNNDLFRLHFFRETGKICTAVENDAFFPGK